MYSLGEERTTSQVDQILKQFGTSDPSGLVIKYEGFREFMITVLAVTDTKEDILNGFKLINLGDEVAKVDKMEMVMEEEDVKYVKETAPAAGSGYDYVSWTNDVFSR